MSEQEEITIPKKIYDSYKQAFDRYENTKLKSRQYMNIKYAENKIKKQKEKLRVKGLTEDEIEFIIKNMD